MHVWVVVLQVGKRVGQFMFDTHSTQYIVVVSHTGASALPAHCVLLVQDVAHVFVLVLHTRPVPQSAFAMH